MAESTIHTFTKLVDEPWFIECRKNLVRNGVQVATITSLNTARIERRVGTNPTETWEIVFEGSDLTSLQILDDGDHTDSMIAGILNADRDTDPPPGSDYMIVCECTIQFTAEFGRGEAGRVFRRRARIVPGAVTAPSS